MTLSLERDRSAAAGRTQTTAPLRRLADRYVLQAVLASANGRAVPEAVIAAFDRLPAAMARAEARDGQIERAVIDLAEVALLVGHEGRAFAATVTDLTESGARIQLNDLPVVARTRAPGVLPGTQIRVRLDSADPVQRRLEFSRVA